MDDFDVLYNQRIINEKRIIDANKTQATRVANPIPKAVVNEFNEIAGDTRAVSHLGPTSVVSDDELMQTYGRGKDIASLERTEDVFMNENFDSREYFDSALQVEHQVMEEMASPVVDIQLNNSEIKETDLPEGKSEPEKMNKDKMFKYGMAAAIAYLIFRGK